MRVCRNKVAMKEISINTPTMRSTIFIGEGVLEARLPLLTKGQTNFVLTDSNVYALYGALIKKYFPDAEIFVLTAGEEYKTLASLTAILEKMAGAGLHRTSKLFAVGGGVIGDIGGLCAALYMRGISCVQIPTTLLAQVDSSVGGKTAVDLGGLKNIVGAFYQPEEVLVEPAFLKTLPAREVKCGLGEIVKYAALNAEIFDLLNAETDDVTRLAFSAPLIEACIRHKARVVQADEKETGERKSLNVGHTTGHAIELSTHLSHGESVLWGMRFETELAIEQGVCNRDYGEELIAIIRRALQVKPSVQLDFSALEKALEKAKSDKKNLGDGKVALAVAKAKDEWTLLYVTFEEYKNALLRICSRA